MSDSTDFILNTPSLTRLAESSSLTDVRPRQGRALLIVVYKSGSKQEVEEQLKELALLSHTFGIEIADKIVVTIRKFEAATYLSSGKLEEVKLKVEEIGANVVIFDDEISPAQQRNLEELLKVTVMDRTEVILGVFAGHARTREAKLQIDLAQVKYQYPRLKRLWTHLSRQSGGGGGSSGGGYLKGEGEKQIEIDRRLLKAKVERLEQELKAVKQNRQTQRNLRERSSIPVFAIVGYTNAGKSTLMNALTQAEVLVEDKLFATLDTTTRKYTLPNKQDILLVDTVGFIRKLPHLLVASFKSTLEEAVEADILIHLIDASNPNAFEQAETTLEVLKELGAKDKPMITVLNKIDRIEEMGIEQKGIAQKLKLHFPRTVEISAQHQTGFDHLLNSMLFTLQEMRQRLVLRIPQQDYHIVSEAIRNGHVFRQDYEENDIILDVELPRPLAGKLHKFQQL